MKNNSTWNDLLKPVVVLTAICLVVSGLLGLTNSITAPIIEQNARLAADAARIELLPEATTGFEMVEGVEMDGVTEVYKALNGAGYTVTGYGKGYGGNVEFMVAFDADGKIVNLKVLSHSETAGLGSKIENPEFLAPFKGTTADLTLSDIDAIGGATISSKASITAVNNARKAFNQYAKGVVVVELTFEEKLAALFGEGTAAAVLSADYAHEDAKEFYTTDKGLVIATEADGFGVQAMDNDTPVVVYTAMNEDGTVAGIMVDVSGESGPGPAAAEDAYTSLFAGVATADDVDVLAGSTYTSGAVKEAVNKAITVYNAIK